MRAHGPLSISSAVALVSAAPRRPDRSGARDPWSPASRGPGGRLDRRL